MSQSANTKAGKAGLVPINRNAVWSFSASHFMNDLMTTGIVPALLPLYKSAFHLSYTSTSLIVLFSYLTSSVMQPVFGYITDRRPAPWMLAFGVTLSATGLALSGLMPSYIWVIVCIMLSGLGSGAFHPEASRGTHLAAGSSKGLAQAIFQVGGNAGQAVGPLLIPLFLLATGIHGLAVFLVIALAGLIVTVRIVPWYGKRLREEQLAKRALQGENHLWALSIFVLVIIFRSWCQIGVAGFLPFYYIQQHIGLARGEIFSFLFLAAGAIGTFIGGALSDKIGRKWILVGSLVTAIPFAWLVPHLHGWLEAVNLFIFGFTVLSSFAVSVVYAQMLLPKNVGMASGLTIGLGVGAGGIGATFFGSIADTYGIGTIFDIIVLLPLVGAVLAIWLPHDRKLQVKQASTPAIEK